MIGNSIVSSQEDGLAKLAKHARIVLVVITGVQLGMAALFWLAGGSAEKVLIVPAVITAALYGALALWASRAPLPAVMIGFGIYLLGIAVRVLQGGSPLEGLLFKVILLALFINGIGAGRQYNDAKKRLGKA